MTNDFISYITPEQAAANDLAARDEIIAALPHCCSDDVAQERNARVYVDPHGRVAALVVLADGREVWLGAAIAHVEGDLAPWAG